jgi:hypothetical protein
MFRTLNALFFGVSIAFSSVVLAQDPKALEFGESITQDDLYSYLSVLASDSLEGRDTGTRGQKMAAEFIKNHFMEFGLEGPVGGSDYYQEFDLRQIKKGKAKVSIKGKTYQSGDEVLIYGKEVIPEMTKMDLVFIGSEEVINYEELGPNTAVAFLFKGFQDMRGKVNEAKGLGVRVCFAIGSENKEEFDQFKDLYKNYFEGYQMSFKGKKEILTVFTHLDLVADAFGKSPGELKGTLDPGVESTSIKIMSKPAMARITTENVLGYLEGGDKKEELIVITAHYDHVGIINGEVYNGADDDASGTSAIMEIAQAFTLAKEAGFTPRRSLLFMAVTGEERGLLGSKYYSENPIFPLENTVTNLNIDMIGRLDEKHKDNPDYVYLIGTKMLSDELHELSEEVNRQYVNLELDYRYNDKNDPNRFYYRSDHYNFAKNNIPVIFYFNGVHDDYHRATDTIEKIHFGKLEKISRLIFYTAWELANRDERVKLN